MHCAERGIGSGSAGEHAAVSVSAEGPGVRVVTAHGELDAYSYPAWRETLLAQLARDDCEVLVADLAEVRFAGVVVVETLVEAAAAARRSGAELRLVVASPAVARLLRVTGIGERFAVYASLADAVASLSAVRDRAGGGA
jgi:anti-anti-sigma factor